MFIKNEELIKEFTRECEKFKKAKGELNIGFITGLFSKLLAKSQMNLDELELRTICATCSHYKSFESHCNLLKCQMRPAEKCNNHVFGR